MKTSISEINRYPNKSKQLVNLVIKPWLDDRYNKVLEGGNKNKIEKYEGMNILNVVVENPTALFKEEGYFHSTIIARKNGLLFPDPKINFFTFEEFLSHIDPNQHIFNNPIIPSLLDLDTLKTIATVVDVFPSNPRYYITTIAETGRYAIMVFSDNIILDMDDIFNTLLDGYDFEEINGTLIEKTDAEHPAHKQKNLTGYITGTVKIKDVLLKENIEFDILNIKVIKGILELREYYYNGRYTYNGDITYSGAKGEK